MIITCSHCGSLHDMPSSSVNHTRDTTTSGQINNEPAARVERQEVALPSQFNTQRKAGGMDITWPVGGLMQGVVLLIIAGAFAYVALTQGLSFLLLASVGIVYFAAVRTLNQHRIRIDSARLRVTQGPLPWPGTRKLDVSDIEQLFSTEYETRVEKGNDSERRFEIQKSYKLSANTRGNGQVTLLRGLSDPLQALWLEQEIERSLGIRDKPMPGEHK